MVTENRDGVFLEEISLKAWLVAARERDEEMALVCSCMGFFIYR